MEKNFSVFSSNDVVISVLNTKIKPENDYIFIRNEKDIIGVLDKNAITEFPANNMLADCKIKPVEIMHDDIRLQEAFKAIDNKKTDTFTYRFLFFKKGDHHALPR